MRTAPAKALVVQNLVPEDLAAPGGRNAVEAVSAVSIVRSMQKFRKYIPHGRGRLIKTSLRFSLGVLGIVLLSLALVALPLVPGSGMYVSWHIHSGQAFLNAEKVRGYHSLAAATLSTDIAAHSQLCWRSIAVGSPQRIQD